MHPRPLRVERERVEPLEARAQRPAQEPHRRSAHALDPTDPGPGPNSIALQRPGRLHRAVQNYEPMSSFDQAAAERYDQVHQRGDEDAAVELLAQLSGGGPALELAIGTGRIALPLAARGI